MDTLEIEVFIRRNSGGHLEARVRQQTAGGYVYGKNLLKRKYWIDSSRLHQEIYWRLSRLTKNVVIGYE